MTVIVHLKVFWQQLTNNCTPHKFQKGSRFPRPPIWRAKNFRESTYFRQAYKENGFLIGVFDGIHHCTIFPENFGLKQMRNAVHTRNRKTTKCDLLLKFTTVNANQLEWFWLFSCLNIWFSFQGFDLNIVVLFCIHVVAMGESGVQFETSSHPAHCGACKYFAIYFSSPDWLFNFIFTVSTTMDWVILALLSFCDYDNGAHCINRW